MAEMADFLLAVLCLEAGAQMTFSGAVMDTSLS